MVKAAVRRIALVIGQDVTFCRNVIRGVRAYALDKPEWLFRNGPPDAATVRACRQWNPDGIIAHLGTAALARQILRLGKPVVDVACVLPKVGVPVVDVDHRAVGRLAADYLLNRGFQTFGFYGSREAYYSRLREQSFVERLAEAGYSVSSCYGEYLPDLPGASHWQGVEQRVQKWLVELPKPAAILAANDIPARYLADQCRQLGLRVPDEVALLGVDDDEFECTLCSPPLSSVAIPSEKIGWEAARLLEEMMSGQPAPSEPLYLPPLGVITRQSTDTLAIGDPVVAAALQFIRRWAHEEIDVSMVAEEAQVARRTLECRFRRLLGRTVLEEIRRYRVELAKQLLAHTDLDMAEVARRSGFANAQRLALVFRQLTGQTPTSYRRQARPYPR